MSKVFAYTPGQITRKDARKLAKAGYVCVEVQNLSAIRIVEPVQDEIVEIVNAACRSSALSSAYDTQAAFVGREVLKAIKARKG